MLLSCPWFDMERDDLESELKQVREKHLWKLFQEALKFEKISSVLILKTYFTSSVSTELFKVKLKGELQAKYELLLFERQTAFPRELAINSYSSFSVLLGSSKSKKKSRHFATGLIIYLIIRLFIFNPIHTGRGVFSTSKPVNCLELQNATSYNLETW